MVLDALKVGWDVQPCTSCVPLFPRCVVFAQSGSGEAFSDCFVGSMLCTFGVTPDVRRDSRQGISCGKEVLNELRNVGTGR